jgi:nucleoside-diphosphate-sugar epimerase
MSYDTRSSFDDPLKTSSFSKGHREVPQLSENLVLQFATSCGVFFFFLLLIAYRLSRFTKTTSDNASETIFDLYRGSRSPFLARLEAKKKKKSKNPTTMREPQQQRKSWVILGGNGFIGAKIVEQLLGDPLFEDEIIVFDMILQEEVKRNPQVTYVRGSITVRAHLDRLLRINDTWDQTELACEKDDNDETDVDEYGTTYPSQREGLVDPLEKEKVSKAKYPPYCVILSAGINPSINHVKEDLLMINGMGAMNVVDSCVAAGVGKLVFTSSAMVGLNIKLNSARKPPTKKPKVSCADEKYCSKSFDAKNSLLKYDGHVKHMVEAYIQDHVVLYDWFHAVSLRPSVVVGHNDRMLMESMINGEQTYIIGQGNNYIDFIDVNCVARAHILAANSLQSPKVDGHCFFITGSCPVTVKQFLGLASQNDTEKYSATTEKSSWGQPLPKTISVNEAFEAASWNKWLYDRFTIHWHSPYLTHDIIHLLSTSWWFDCKAAKAAFNWEPKNVLEVIADFVAEGQCQLIKSKKYS